MKKRKIVLLALICLILGIVTSCMEPSPLTGKWSDNYSSLTLTADMTCSVTIDDGTGKSESRDGTYSVSNNVLVFRFDQGYTVLSEWDIRGSMLYLYWPTPKDIQKPITELVLYKIGS